MFKEKNVIITGATSGIGYEFVKQFIGEGANLYLVGRNFKKINNLIQSFPNGKIFKIVCDLKNPTDLENLVNQINTDCKSIDLLLHCAGVIHQDPVISTHIEDFDEQLWINLRIPVYLTQKFMAKIIESKGIILFMNSTGGLYIKENNSQYAATKAGLKIFADILRKEVEGKEVKVIQVFPGATATPMQEKIQRDAGNEYIPSEYIPPQEIAGIVMNVLLQSKYSLISDLVIRNKTW